MKFIFTCIIISLILTSCNRKAQFYNSTYSKKSVIVDGELSEWQLPLEQPSQQVALKYRCSNDKEYLYLAVQAANDFTKALILQQGCKIWMDSTAKRKEKFGLDYPLPLKEQEIEALYSEAKGDEKKFLALYGNAMQEFEVLGWADEALRFSNLTSKDIKVALAFDELKMLYMEFRIPLKQIFGREAQLDEIFSLGIVINKAKTAPVDNNDDGLFNDRNQTGITQSNPMLGPNPNQRQFNGPSRDLSMPNIWMKIKLNSGTSE